MRAAHRLYTLTALTMLQVACGNPPPPPTPPPAPPPPSATVAPPAPEADLSPVSEPKLLIGMGRLKSVTGTLAAIDKLGKNPMPVPLEEVVKTDLIGKALRDPELGKLVKLDSSIDAAVTLDPASSEDKPEVFAAFSLPLKSMDQALAVVNRAGSAAMVKPGVYRLGKQPMDVTCDLAASVGDAPARLVCGPKERDVEALLPWLTRGAPTAQMGSADMHVEARFSAVRERYRSLIDQFGPRLPGLAAAEIGRKDASLRDPAVQDAVSAIVKEGVQAGEEIDAIAADMTIDGGTGQATFSGALKFKGNKSWFVRALTSRNEKAGPPPAIFWQAPKDADMVAFGLATDPKLLEPLRKGATDVFGALTKGRLPDADRKTISDAIAHTPLVEAAVVSASGHPEPPEPKAPKGELTPADAVRMSHDLVVASLGWSMVGVESKAEPWNNWLKDLVKSYNSPGIQKLLKQEAKKLSVPTVRSVGAPKGLPAGTQAVELAVEIDSHMIWGRYWRMHHGKEHPKGAPAKAKIGVTLAVIPDGDRTWIGFAGDPAVIASHFNAVKSGAPKDGTIADRPGLDALKSGKNVAGGFFSIAGLINTVKGAAARELSHRDRKQMAEALATMPNKGATPILFSADGEGGGNPTATTEIRVQKGTFEDIQALVMMAMSERSSAPEPSEAPPPPATPAPAPKGGRKKK